jgi:hypothetical protein
MRNNSELLSFSGTTSRKTCEATYTKLTKRLWPQLTRSLQSRKHQENVAKTQQKIFFDPW